MFPDMGFCRAPTVSFTAPPPHGVDGPARPTHSGYFRYRVLCALGLVRREWAPVNICSPSPANHNRAPRGSEEATILPQGHSGKSGSRKQMGLFTETWSLGCTLRPRGQSSQGSSNQVSFICFTEYCTRSQRVSLTCTVASNYLELLDFMRIDRCRRLCHSATIKYCSL